MSEVTADGADLDAPDDNATAPQAPELNLDEEECPSMAPPWMATFSDLGTLLMAFFVLILARSVVDSPRMETVMGSVALAFGVERIVPKLEIPMGETLLETDYTPSDAENTIASDATQNSADTTQDYIKQMTERGDAVSNIQGEYIQVLEELENEIETGQVNVTLEDEKIVVEMTEGDDGAKGKDGRAKGGVTQETIEVAKKIHDLTTFATSNIVLKREPGWEAKGREVTTLSSVEEIKSALSEEIKDGIAEVEKQGDSVLIRLTKADSFVSGEATLSRNFETTLLRVGSALESTIGVIRVEGHTDNQMVGFSDRYKSNFDLSAARAAAVADYLTDNTNLETGRLTIRGLADTKPIAANDSSEGRAKNRRIELYLDE
ncbi:MAG: flagellar motor protein [Gammaproteobacteria bacterium TMED92]|nr:MAG: flagellar motor protein [Gammaproteobacteria bacterium TMED92]